jgi:N-acetylglucosaminyldiphosphoundecaprenol N-acetyl-beta-D-mannosaminyltransferase
MSVSESITKSASARGKIRRIPGVPARVDITLPTDVDEDEAEATAESLDPVDRSATADRTAGSRAGARAEREAADVAQPARVSIQGVMIDAVDWQQAVGRIETWAAQRRSSVVAICNSHSVVTAADDPDFARALAAADMATADGMPIAWMMRRLGHPAQQRINGPDLMLRYCATAERTGTSIFLYGSTDEVLGRLQAQLCERFPGLKIAGRYSPPFRTLTSAEDDEVCKRIAESGAGVVFVSLGCPKQEKWMDAHRGRVPAVMIGVGAAFDYHAGTLSRAPAWMRDSGLEWLHRLASEPRRLWKRYLVTNTLFAVRALAQLVGRR